MPTWPVQTVMGRVVQEAVFFAALAEVVILPQRNFNKTPTGKRKTAFSQQNYWKPFYRLLPILYKHLCAGFKTWESLPRSTWGIFCCRNLYCNPTRLPWQRSSCAAWPFKQNVCWQVYLDWTWTANYSRTHCHAYSPRLPACHFWTGCHTITKNFYPNNSPCYPWTSWRNKIHDARNLPFSGSKKNWWN